MLSFLAAFVLFAGQSTMPTGQADLLRQIVPQPTGTNGYEDYLRAATVVNNPQVSGWLALHAGRAPERMPEGLSSDSSYLEQCQWLWEHFGKVADNVRAGNTKPISDPRTDGYFDRKYQEMRHFRSVTEVLNAGAYYELSRGNSAAATRLLCDALTMDRNQYRHGPMIAFLYSVIQNYAVYVTIAERLDCFSEADLKVLLACARQLEADAPTVPELLLTQYQLLAGSLKVYLDPKSFPDNELNYEEYDQLGKIVKSLSDVERERLMTELPGRLEQVLKSDLAPFLAPEAKWPLDLARPEYGPTGDPKRDIPQYIARVSVPSYGNAIRYMLVTRTQNRLLAMNCQILLFRWQNERLPATLAEAGIDSTDPINGGKFVYDVVGSEYDLYSRGRPEIGRIDLYPVARMSDPTSAAPPAP